MSISRIAISVALVIFSHSFSAAAPVEKAAEAWWLSARFEPESKDYLSIPVRQIAQDWEKITVLSYDRMPSEAQEDLVWMKKNNFKFEADLLNKQTKLKNRIVTGTFKNISGSEGVFLLVLEQMKDRSWHRRYLHTESIGAKFSVILEKRNGVFYWNTCIMCSDFRRLDMISKPIHLH